MRSLQIDRRAELDVAKDRIRVPDAWRALGLPGEPHPNPCRSPFREDRRASFSVYNDGMAWKDHATGEGGDIVDFVAAALRCPVPEAIAWLRERAGAGRALPAKAPSGRSQHDRKPAAPAFSLPTIGTLAEIQLVRRWPLFAGMEIATQRGIFHACTMTDDGAEAKAWALTDSAQKSIQVRRVDGAPWRWCNAKAWTIGGSIAGWPIGCAEVGSRPVVLFCEGGPDLLAAFTLAFLHEYHRAVAAVCLPGASASIAEDALPHFAGKRVRIFEHADAAGAKAGNKWAGQLRQAGARVDGFTFDPPFKDLADVLAGVDAGELEPPINIFEGLEEDLACR